MRILFIPELLSIYISLNFSTYILAPLRYYSRSLGYFWIIDSIFNLLIRKNHLVIEEFRIVDFDCICIDLFN